MRRARLPDVAATAAALFFGVCEVLVVDRILFRNPAEYGFVLESIRGVLAGTPVSKSWAHRVLAPHVFTALLGEPTLPALRTFTNAMVVASSVLVFGLLRVRGSTVPRALAGCAAYGLLRVLFTYDLEYLWDELDVCLFAAFGYAVGTKRPIPWSIPLLALGSWNHETILFVPLWFALAFLERPRPERVRSAVLFGVAMAALVAVVIAVTRNALYVGRPDLPARVFEQRTSVIENHVHVSHNLRQLFFADFRRGRSFIALSFYAACAGMAVRIARGRDIRAACWTLAFLATVVVFGYVNETRHYLPLIAFFGVYGFARTATEQTPAA